MPRVLREAPIDDDQRPTRSASSPGSLSLLRESLGAVSEDWIADSSPQIISTRLMM
jgi:hypothetical protein